MILQSIAWAVILISLLALIATLVDSWERGIEKDVSSFEKEFRMGLPKELHELILVDGRTRHRHFVHVEPTELARMMVVWIAASEHDSSELWFEGKLLTTCEGLEKEVVEERWWET